MIVAIISSLFLLALGGILRSEQLRKIPLLRPISIYFFAEAAWTLLSGLLILIWRNAAEWASFGHYVLMAVVAGYVFYCCSSEYQARKKTDDTARTYERAELKKSGKKAGRKTAP